MYECYFIFALDKNQTIFCVRIQKVHLIGFNTDGGFLDRGSVENSRNVFFINNNNNKNRRMHSMYIPQLVKMYAHYLHTIFELERVFFKRTIQ